MLEELTILEENLTLIAGYGYCKRGPTGNLIRNLKKEFKISYKKHYNQLKTREIDLFKKGGDLTICLKFDKHQELNVLLIVFGSEYNNIRKYFNYFSEKMEPPLIENKAYQNNIVEFVRGFFSAIKNSGKNE